MAKKRRRGRPRRIGRPRSKKHRKVGRPRRVGRPRTKRRKNKRRHYHHRLDISFLRHKFKRNKRKVKNKRMIDRRESSSYDGSCYGVLSCEGKANTFGTELSFGC